MRLQHADPVLNSALEHYTQLNMDDTFNLMFYFLHGSNMFCFS